MLLAIAWRVASKCNLEILSFMRALIPNLKRELATALLLASATMFVSCASQKQQVRLVDDPDAHHESTIPWDKQEKWETENQFSGMTDRR